MTAATQTPPRTVDSILEQLDTFKQRATYGAVARTLGRSPRNLMQGRTRSQRDSWIVSLRDGRPTGYEPDQIHPEIASRERILKASEELESWLKDPS